MSVVINTNYAATVASNNLAASNSMLQKSLNRLSSGTKIVNPADDAGGLAVSMKLSAAARRSGAASNNIANGISFLQTQDGVLKTAAKVLDRISELKTLYSDQTKSTTDKGQYDTEFTALKSELTALNGETFNGIALFGVAKTVNTTEDASANGQVTISGATDLDSQTNVVMVATAASLADFDVSQIKSAINDVATMRATNGAQQTRLGFAAEVLTINKANLEAASSRITDVDVASESTQLARWNILVQSGTAMLAQANQSAQSALRLIQ